MIEIIDSDVKKKGEKILTKQGWAEGLVMNRTLSSMSEKLPNAEVCMRSSQICRILEILL